MSTIKPYQDNETRRQYKNLTLTQRKNISELKEGVVVNSMIKDVQKDSIQDFSGINDMYDNLVIPDRTTKTDSFKYEYEEAKKPLYKSMKPLILSTLGLFGVLAGSMFAVKKAADYKTRMKPWQTLQEITKHVSVNDEPHLAMLLMIRDPNFRNIMGALGVFVLSSVGFVGKNYVDGVKEIWVRKKQADVQRDLQEKLIEVETKSFSGKTQIVRNMLTEKAQELNNILHKDNFANEKTTFKKFISFKKSNTMTPNEEKRNNLVSTLSIAAGTVAIGLLGILAFKNLQKAAKTCQNYANETLKNFAEEIEKLKNPTNIDLEKLKNTIVSLNLKTSEIEQFFQNAKNIPEGKFQAINGNVYKNYQDYVLREAQKLTDEGAEAIAGKPSSKPVIFSYTGDLCSHFYNMIVNPESPLLKIVFAGMAAVTSIGYAGAKTVEAIKEAQVIKENAKTELDLQKRLVNVELKNFETKKRSVIEPLIDEFKIQARQGKDKSELKTRAENILCEIKNGPPFVYS